MKRTWRYSPDGSCVEVVRKRKTERHHAIIPDSMEPHRNMQTGQMVDSKTTHRRILRENGLIEFGNERDAFERAAHPLDYEKTADEAIPDSWARDLLEGAKNG